MRCKATHRKRQFPDSRTGVVILGPRTRLGKALLSLPWARRYDLLLVARHPQEGDAFVSQWPGTAVLPAWDADWTWPTHYDKVIMCCCAVGLIHPRTPQWSADCVEVTRDLGIIEKVLNAYPNVSVRVIFVSTVLALSPQFTQAYYIGWKRVIEGNISSMVSRHPQAIFSVLYPGRLIKKKSLIRPTSILQTTFNRLARVLSKTGNSSNPCKRLLGLDARLWLTWNGLATCSKAISW